MDSGRSGKPSLPMTLQKLWERCPSTAQICLLLACWYASSSVSNMVTKVLLNRDQNPTTITLCHFFFVTFFSRLYLFYKRGESRFFDIPEPDRLRVTLPISCAGFVGHWLSALALSYVSVSFTHTIKATSPIYSVFLTRWLLKEPTSLPVMLSLIPIVFGVVLSSTTDTEVNLMGFICAMLSTIVFVFQNVYSKKLSLDMEETEMLFYSALTCFAGLLPLWLCFNIYAASSAPANFTASFSLATLLELFFIFVGGGFSYFIQNLAAVMTLRRMSPLSYSIGNTLKRVFVIISSVIYFATPIAPRNALGMLIAFLGVLLYDHARRRKRDPVLPYTMSSATLIV
jgi:solute carrier family 35 protein E1